MLNTYPKFAKGELQNIKKKMSKKNVDIINTFYKECSTSAGNKKLQKIEQILVQFQYITKANLDNIDKEIVDSFLALLKNSYRTEWSKNEVKIYLKKFLLWKYKDLDMIKNIKLNSKPFNEEKINENVLFNKKDIEKLIRAAETLRWKAFIMLAFETGARPQELQDLKWQHIKFEDGYGLVQLYSKKTGSSRSFPIKEAVIHLKRWKKEFCYPDIKEEDYVFPSPFYRHKPMTTSAFLINLKEIGKRAGINRNIFTYLFRHSRAHFLYDKLPQKKVEKLMGHTDMADIYAHMSNEQAIQSMLKEIYHIEELSESDNQKMIEMEERIKHLEDTLGNIGAITKSLKQIIKKRMEKKQE